MYSVAILYTFRSTITVLKRASESADHGHDAQHLLYNICCTCLGARLQRASDHGHDAQHAGQEAQPAGPTEATDNAQETRYRYDRVGRRY